MKHRACACKRQKILDCDSSTKSQQETLRVAIKILPVSYSAVANRFTKFYQNALITFD